MSNVLIMWLQVSDESLLVQFCVAFFAPKTHPPMLKYVMEHFSYIEKEMHQCIIFTQDV